ncbi:hypothetical protein GCM10010911_15020 [Paenibacillus nasutitermitis]|uniref:Cys/Met metabolism PLP-dependent enzyme n=1 Tax=Paenibacillus nasutitermitis TaxID=1652958 RepID=A0A916YS21_9BACL|nr:hypothetical protein GCM10010911_15020 [Paenibacillus nasutitermitis]
MERFMDSLQIFKIGVNWGGYESLVYSPGLGIHPAQTTRTEYETRLEHTIRLSVGLEETADLMEDVFQALDCI